MKRLSLLPLVVLLAAGGCKLLDRGGARETPEQLLQSALFAFRGGDIRLADQILDRARQAHPLHGGLLLWSAALADMQWHDASALQLLLTALRSSDRAGLSEAEVHGRIGELLFRMGRYGESLPYLNAGAAAAAAAGAAAADTASVPAGDAAAPADSAPARRRAMARVAMLLPYVQRESPARAVELPLLPEAMPEVMCTLGSQQRSMVVDTGAARTTIAASWAEGVVRSGSPAGTLRDGVGREFPCLIGLLPSLDLGGLDAGPLAVCIVDDTRLALQDHFGGPPRPTSGVLGADVLARLRVTIDPRQGTIRFAPVVEPPLEGYVACLRADDCLLVPVRIEAVSLWFLLDTGASHSSLTAQGLAALPGGERRAIESYRHIRTPGGLGFAVRLVPRLTLEVSQARIAGVELPVVERATSTGFPVHGVLGSDLLMRCRTTLVRGRVRMEVIDGE